MNGKQRRVAYEDSMVIAVALQGRASTLAYPILCSELDALFRLVRPLADADDALRNCEALQYRCTRSAAPTKRSIT
jgi:hypothetical protein